MPQISFSRLTLLGLIVLSVFFVELGAARLWDRDEPRNSRASHEMLSRGDWIVPTFNGQLRDHKPVLLYWGQMASYLLIGESEFAARLPSAICAILATLSIAILASRLSGHSKGISTEGFWAAGAMATCLLLVMAGRAATPDGCLIAFSTIGVAALVLSAVAPAPPYSVGRVGRARWIPAAFGYTMLSLAALAKGPVGIVLPLAVVHVWWMVCKRMQSPAGTAPDDPASADSKAGSLGKSLFWWIKELWLTFNPLQCLKAAWALRAIPGVLLSLLLAAPWYVAVGMETDGAFLRGFFLEHNVGRALHSMEGHGGSLLFYPLALIAGTFPWSLWLIPILMWCRKASRESVVRRQMIVLSAAWVSVYVVAFSIASTKLPSYITPCYAGAALAIGGYLHQFESGWSLPSPGIRRLAYVLTIFVGIAMSGGILWLSAHEAMPLLARAALGGGVISLLGICGLVWERFSRVAWVPTTWLVGAAAFQIILFGFGAKSVDRYRDDLRLLSDVQLEAPSEHWLSIGGMEPSWVHYLDHEIEEIVDSAAQASSWQRVEEFLQRHPDGRILVVGQTAYDALCSLRQDGRLVQLTEIDQASRFLRPGLVRVYRGEQARHADLVPGTPEPTSTPIAVSAGPPVTNPLPELPLPQASPPEIPLAERPVSENSDSENTISEELIPQDTAPPSTPQQAPRRVAAHPEHPNPLRPR